MAIESCSDVVNLADELVHGAGWLVDLAHLERVGFLPKVWLAPQEVRELRRLVRYRQGLLCDRRNTKLRVSALLRDLRIRNAPADPWTKPWLHWLRNNDALSEQTRWIIDRLLAKMAFVIDEIAAVEKRLSQAAA